MSAGVLDRRLWVWGGIAVAALLVIATWLVVVGPHRSDTAQLREDTASVQLQNDVLAGKTATLRRQAGDRGKLQQDLRDALQQLPADSGLPVFTRQLASQAASYGISVRSISVGTSTLATPAAPAADPTPVPTDPTGATATPTAAPVTAGATVLAIPITIITEGPALDQLRFLRDIQQSGPRRALVTGTAISALGKKTVAVSSTMTTQLSVFSSSLSDADQARLDKLLGSGDGSD